MRARARNADSRPSHEAAALAEFRAGTHRDIILRYVLSNPGHTHAEIAEATGLKASAVHKRLPELREAGFIFNGEQRMCRINGTLMNTWVKPGHIPEIL